MDMYKDVPTVDPAGVCARGSDVPPQLYNKYAFTLILAVDA